MLHLPGTTRHARWCTDRPPRHVSRWFASCLTCGNVDSNGLGSCGLGGVSVRPQRRPCGAAAGHFRLPSAPCRFAFGAGRRWPSRHRTDMPKPRTISLRDHPGRQRSTDPMRFFSQENQRLQLAGKISRPSFHASVNGGEGSPSRATGSLPWFETALGGPHHSPTARKNDERPRGRTDEHLSSHTHASHAGRAEG